MSRTRSIAAGSLVIVSAAAFMAGASASDAVRALVPGLVTTVSAQDPVPPPAQDPEPGGRGRQGGAAQGPRPYAQVVTSSTRTDEGIFKVHRNGDTVLFEIPKAELNKDFVWKVGIRKTTLGAGFGGQEVTNRVVRWSLKGDRVLLLGIDYSTYADPSLPVAEAVENANYPSIIRALPVAAYSPAGDPVVDVTFFFNADSVPEFSVRQALGANQLDGQRTFIERVVALPENINAESTMTFSGAAGGGGARGGGGGAGGARGMRGPSGTVVVAHSIVKLPEQPMMSRYFDYRVGYVAQQMTDYGTEEHRSVNKRFIHRFRLEKKDPSAAVSDVVKPLVFYIDSATPKSMVPYVRRGVEEWQRAFEAAGFRNAIVAREEPTNDQEFMADDARYSVIRWVPSTQENSSTIIDPRSGEILSANIEVYPNVGTFGPYSYFVQAGAVDPRAQQIPLPEALQGELIRYFVSHQIGHALGLEHNSKAASAYTIEQIRDPKFVKTMGFTPTVMDESRYHYVAQPEDKIDPADLIPRVGPYDMFAIKWGYGPVPNAKSPDDERNMLDQWAREQDKNAYLRYSTEGASNVDPGDAPEAVGSNNPVMATTLGVRNLVKVSDMLLKATSTRVGDPWEDLEAAYGRLVTQWATEMGHVVRVVGGLETQQVHIGQTGMRFRTIPRARQVEAMQYLLANAFTTPTFLIKPEILRRIEVSGAVNRIRNAQASLLNQLLQPQRLDRMTEQFTLDGAQAYPPLQMLMDLRNGIWSELAKPGTAISLYRRNVQRAYLDTMDQRLNGTPASSAEIRAMVKGELRALDAQLRTAAGAAGLDEATRRHLTDARDEIAAILDPRVPRAPAEAGAAGGGRGRGGIR